MLEIIQKLNASDLALRFVVEKFIAEDTVKYLKVKVFLKDGSLLFIKNLVTENQHKYSYHWQTRAGKLICRWDNAPHVVGKKRLTDHIHDGEKVIPCRQVTIDDVLEYIGESGCKI